MIKESILFVVATGALIYFVTPTEKTAEPDADAQAPQTVAPEATQPSDDGWGDEDEVEDEEESFIFGEPLTNLDDDYGDEPADAKEEESPGSREEAEPASSRPATVARSQGGLSANGPAPNEKGGVNNPIIFKTANPSDPEDD